MNDRWESGFLVYVVPVGTDQYVEDMLNSKIDEIESIAVRACEVLAGEVQTLWTVFRLSIMQRFDYWLQLVHPSQVKKAAERMNKVAKDVLVKIVGVPVPQEGEGLSYTCPLGVEVRGLRGRSFQSLLSSLPVKFGGLGLRDQVQLSPAAYVAGLEQALPFFGGEKGICPPLEQLGGGMGRPAERWRPLLEGGGRTAREFAGAWEVLSGEARELCDYLGEELSGALAIPVEGAGDGSTKGDTRKAVVTQLESLRHRVLSKHLKEWQQRTDRPVWSWPNRDKLSTAWLLSFPGPHTGLSKPVFREGMAMLLCIPSPACRDMVGERVGTGKVDLFGDTVLCQNLPGDGWRIRHDRIKQEIMCMMGWSGMTATCEVWGLFKHLVPMDRQGSEEIMKQRQVMIPDFRIQLSSQTGQSEARLAELKFTCGRDLYRPGVRQREFKRAVDRRAGTLMEDYRGKADGMDKLLGEEGGGRVRRKLDQFGDLLGLVVGRFNEVSNDLSNLLQSMAESRVNMIARRDGRQLSDHEQGVVVGQLRRQLSTASIRAASNCLLDRMHQCGQGAQMAAKRREGAAWLEEVMKSEREVQWLAKLRGGQLVQKGRFLVSD